ncbi:MAG: glycosyltransferase [Alicyclobacillus sp.]|nr:glycosyltransferase [Alicyclobacillus sp.]
MNETLDVLLLSAGYGEGHHQSARAIEEALQSVWPGCRTQVLDYLAYVPDFIEHATVGLYKVMSKHSPWVYAGVYHLTSQIAGMWGWSHIEYSLGRQNLRNLLTQLQPKVIICTHPLPMAVLSTMRKQGASIAPVFGVITDYVLHGEWVQPELDHYYVPTPLLRAALCERGLDSAKITVSGIPVRPVFSAIGTPTTARARLRWPEVPTVLFMCSALGTLGGVYEACQALLDSREVFRLVVVCGRDEALAERLRTLPPQGRGHDIRVLGFAHNIADLMRASEIVITKAGGITLSEALALERPMVIYRPLPGQELGNARFAARRGAARIAKTPETLRAEVEMLLADDQLRRRMAARARQIAHPDAARRIAQDAWAMAHRHATQGV